MNKVFVRTKNVKKFVALMEEVKQLPANIPKIVLVFGEYGLGKSETIKWWTFKNDCIYVRANQGMTSRWLLSEIAEELGEEAFWHIQDTFNLVEQKLKQNPKPLIIDEVDYLVTNNVIEILRDLHDRTGCPMILVGMVNIDKKLSRYPHLKDRIYKAFKFEPYDKQDIMQILSELSEIPITNDGLEYLATRHNQLRQIVKLINKIEKLAKTNELKELNEKNLRSILNEGQNITALQTSKQIFA
nr:MAG TPA: AAA domain protein [Caudoviricetes sp.]